MELKDIIQILEQFRYNDDGKVITWPYHVRFYEVVDYFKEQRKQRLKRAYEDGFSQTRSNFHPAGSEEYKAFEDGWSTKNKELVKTFKLVKENLDVNTRNRYICNVLHSLAKKKLITHRSSKAAIDVIRSRIRMNAFNSYVSLEWWVCCHVLGGAWPLKDDMYIYRQRWLDHLIEEFS